METYEYIVAGAGSGGCAVAARLVEGGASVLLLEAGPANDTPEVQIPAAFAQLFHSDRDWDYRTEPEPTLDGRTIYQPRAKTMGGCSSMNCMVHLRGCSEDYDNWAQYGVEGWAWSDVEPFFDKSPLGWRELPSPDPLSEAFVESAVAAGIQENPTHFGPNLDGVSLSKTTTRDGHRYDAATAYLGPLSNNSLLQIVTGALIDKVIVEDGVATGVRYLIDGQPVESRASREVIVSAGAFGTPEILQRSGIGPADHLSALGITPVADLPAVGANLMDHPMTLMNWEIEGDQVGLFDADDPSYVAMWAEEGKGKLTSNVAEATAHVRTEPGLPAPDFQIVFVPSYFREHGAQVHDKPAFTLGQSYWTPTSVGTVLIASADPQRRAQVHLNLLSDRAEIAAMIRAIRLSREIVSSGPLASHAGVELSPGLQIDSDDDLEAWIRANVEHTYHPSCTVRMGTDGALDSQLRVRGVAGLRVADASVFPVIPRANTNMPAVVVGERCADFIIRSKKAAESVAAAR
ncbi:GMC family oxidoreductase [Tsukamurella spumae]|uniref:Oxidoreductase n=1 Tax=Tsukamurella spumae TaxID=44753 RepID=A0A846X9E0_9ACTN|nr:GMC family oxidoreductase N-terminal domain-containing protein [Tsukamurella spumae]NKY20842.1 oxidoreductase [Tsukamurella spumae]